MYCTNRPELNSSVAVVPTTKWLPSGGGTDAVHTQRKAESVYVQRLQAGGRAASYRTGGAGGVPAAAAAGAGGAGGRGGSRVRLANAALVQRSTWRRENMRALNCAGRRQQQVLQLNCFNGPHTSHPFLAQLASGLALSSAPTLPTPL